MQEEQTKHVRNRVSNKLPVIVAILLLSCFLLIGIWSVRNSIFTSFHVQRINVEDGVSEEIVLYDTFYESIKNPQHFNENFEKAYYIINFYYDIKGKVSLVTWDDTSNNWSDCELIEINNKEYKFNFPNDLNEDEVANYKLTVDKYEFYFTIVNLNKTD